METLEIATADRAGHDLLKRVVRAPSGLVLLQGGNSAALVAHFRTIARRSGQAVYLWQPSVGMSSLRDLHAPVPGCERLGSALRYVLQSMHFGIYLLAGIELPLSAGNRHLLEQVAIEPSGHLRRVVVLDPSDAVVAHLASSAVAIDASATSTPGLRLRDGRWLMDQA